MKPNLFAKGHKAVYDRFNSNSFALLSRYGNNIPPFVTANLITTCRLTLVFPTTILLSNGYTWLPASLVIVNALFDYVDGAVARWERNDKDRILKLAQGPLASKVPLGVTLNSKSVALHTNWGAYYDALADKLFAIPVWVSICALYPAAPWIQAFASAHILCESISAFVRTQSFFLNPQASSKVVTAGAMGKVKQAISMLGTALVLVPETQVVGGILLGGSLPFSFASLQDKMASNAHVPRVVLLLQEKPNYPHILQRLRDRQGKFDTIVCVQKEEEKSFWLDLGEVVWGVKVLHKERLDFEDVMQMGAESVLVESKEMLSSNLGLSQRIGVEVL